MVLVNTVFALSIRKKSSAIIFNSAITISRLGTAFDKAAASGNVVATESSTMENKNTMFNWMSCLPEKLQQIPIWELTLPGSHDAGSFGLETKSGIAPDKPDFQKWWIRMFGFIVYPFFKKWTVTQKLDIYKQLHSGIRYFDFRAAPKPGDDELYFVHGLYGLRIMEMIDDINLFLEENKREVVIIHLQHFISALPEQEVNLLQKVLSVLGSKVCPYPSPYQSPQKKVTLQYLWKSGYQVFLFYPLESQTTSEYLWPASLLPNPWPNTTQLDFLTTFLSEHVDHRLTDRFFVTQCVLTPDNKYVTSHLFSSLYSKLCCPCNRVITEWLKDKGAGPRGPNIVMIDFVEWNDDQIPRTVVNLNYRYHLATC